MLRLDSASPSGVAHRRDRHDLAREVEVADHPPHEQHLLGVLLPEERHVRRGDVQQLSDDREHTVEVTRARRALEYIAERSGRHAHQRRPAG